MTSTGIHHITAISSSAQKTYNFYTDILGLRLVKKTINQDAIDVLHLYFGDRLGVPGTGLTFFPFEDAANGRRGVGQVTTISFAIKKSSLGFWIERFINKGVKHERVSDHFGNKSIIFYDFDGLQLELVATDESFETAPYTHNEIPADHTILGFYSATLSVDKIEQTATVLKELGYEELESVQFYTRFVNRYAKFAKYLILFKMGGWSEGIQSAGSVHHIAFTAETDQVQLELSKKMEDLGLRPTDVIDRYYFKSVYYREPGNILFEIATREPGFTVDESEDQLGSELVLPPKFQEMRAEIERKVPLLITDKSHFESGYIYKFVEGRNNKLLILLHGTGGDENDLIGPIGSLDKDSSILSLRGDVSEEGNLRFFKRFPDGSFDYEDLENRVETFVKFLKKELVRLKVDHMENLFVGFSNGANFIAALSYKYPELVSKAILIRAKKPFVEEVDGKVRGRSNILILSGKNDPFVPEQEAKDLATDLKNAGFVVTQKFTGDGHNLNSNDLSEIRDFVVLL